MNKVEKFVEAAKSSGYKIEIFINAANNTSESIQKWTLRRENEVIEGKKDMPHGLNILIGEFFKKFNVKVHYSKVDNDDTIAAFANFYNGNVVSADKDFLRYLNRKYKIYDDFKVKNGKLILFERNYNISN